MENNNANGTNMDSGSSVDSSSWEKVDYQQEPDQKDAGAASHGQQPPPPHHAPHPGEVIPKAQQFPHDTREKPLYPHQEQPLHMEAAVPTEVVRPHPVNAPSPRCYETQRQESPFRPIVPGTDSGSEPSRPNSVSAAPDLSCKVDSPLLDGIQGQRLQSISPPSELSRPNSLNATPDLSHSVTPPLLSDIRDDNPHPSFSPRLEEKGEPDGSSFSIPVKATFSSSLADKSPSPQLQESQSREEEFDQTSCIPPPKPDEQPYWQPHAYDSHPAPPPVRQELHQPSSWPDSTHGHPQSRPGAPPKDNQPPPGKEVHRQTSSAEPPKAAAVLPPPPSGNPRPMLQEPMGSSEQQQQQAPYNQRTSPAARNLQPSPSHKPPNPSSISLRRFIPGEQESSSNRVVPGGASPPSASLGAIPGASVPQKNNYPGDGQADTYPPGGPSRETPPIRKETLGSEGDNRNKSFQPVRGDANHDRGYGGERSNRDDYMDQERYHRPGESRNDVYPRPEDVPDSRRAPYRSDRAEAYYKPDSRGEYVEGSYVGGENKDESTDSRRDGMPQGGHRRDPYAVAPSREEFLERRDDRFPDARRETYPGSQSRDEYPENRRDNVTAGEEYRMQRRDSFPDSPRSTNYPEGSERPQHHRPGVRPGDYGGGRSGGHDGRGGHDLSYSRRMDYYEEGSRGRNPNERGMYDDRYDDRRREYWDRNEYDRRGDYPRTMHDRSHPDGYRGGGGHDSRKYGDDMGRGDFDDRRSCVTDDYPGYGRSGSPSSRGEHNRTFEGGYSEEGRHDYRERRDLFYRSMDDYIYRNSGSQSRPHSRPSSRGGDMHMEDPSERRPPQMPYPHHQMYPPSHYPNPYDRRQDYRPYGGRQGYYSYPWYYQYYQYYNEEAKRQYKEWYEKHYGRDFDGSDMPGSIRSTHSSEDLQRERFVTDFHDQGAEQSTILPDKEPSYGSTSEPYVRVASERSTPRLYTGQHSVGRIGLNGVVLRLGGVGKQGTKVDLLDLQELLCDLPQSKELKNFPGPLIRGHTPKKNIMQFCTEKLRNLQMGPSFPDRSSAILIWELLLLLVRQNGSVEGNDLSELLLKDQTMASSTAEPSEPPPSSSSSSSSVVVSDRTIVNKNTEAQDFAKLMDYLLYGHKEKALEWAMKRGMWGHAMFLADLMGGKMSGHVRMRFANSFPVTSPLQTLFQLLSGRQPTATTMVSEENWSDWRPHLAMMLSNSSPRPEVDSQSIIAMGDSLAARGLLYSAHFCYVVGKAEFGKFSRKTSKLVLLGASHHSPYEKFATNEAIQCTEVYEYALSLANNDFILPTFQTYKLMYACRLLDAGLVTEALGYLKQISRAVCLLLDGMDLSFMRLVYNLGHRLQACQSTSYDDSEWLTSLETSIYHKSTTMYQNTEQVNQEIQEAAPVPMVETDSYEQQQATGYRSEEAGVEQQQETYQQQQEAYQQQQEAYQQQQEAYQQQQYPEQPSVNMVAAAEQPQIGYDAQVEPLIPPWQPPPLEQPPVDSAPYQGMPPQPIDNSQMDYWDNVTARKDSASTVSSLPSSGYQPPVVEQPQPSPPPPPPPPPEPEQSSKLDDSKSKQKNEKKAEGGGWFGGFLGKLPSFRAKNQAILPDDKNPTIVWDDVKKRWVNTEEGDDGETSGAAAPPPKASDLAPKPAPTMMGDAPPPPPGGNMYKLQRVRGVRGNYVDVLGGNTSSRPQPPPAAGQPPPPQQPQPAAPAQGESVSMGDPIDVPASAPMDGPLMINPNQFSALPPSNSRANTLARRYPPR